LIKDSCVDRIVRYLDEGLIKRLLDADPSNIKFLVAVSHEISTLKDSSHLVPENERIGYYDVLMRILNEPKYRDTAFRHYFLLLKNMKAEAFAVLSNLEAVYTGDSWLPDSLVFRSEFLLLYRHLLKNYWPKDTTRFDDPIHTIDVSYPLLYVSWLSCLESLVHVFGDQSFTKILKPSQTNQQIRQYNMDVMYSYPLVVDNDMLTITASSVLGEHYDKSRLIDYDLNTVWAEGAPSDGSHEWLDIRLAEQTDVHELILFPGHSKSIELFLQNNRIKSLSLSIDGVATTFPVPDAFVPIAIPIDRPLSRVRIEIVGVYRGTKYDDLCVGEIVLTRNRIAW